MVGVARFELATPASRRRCSTRLSYTPNRGAAYSQLFCPVQRGKDRVSHRPAVAPCFALITGRQLQNLLNQLRRTALGRCIPLSGYVFTALRLHRRLRLGRRQVVRHRFLVPAFPGSNPGAPAILFQTLLISRPPGHPSGLVRPAVRSAIRSRSGQRCAMP